MLITAPSVDPIAGPITIGRKKRARPANEKQALACLLIVFILSDLFMSLVIIKVIKKI